MSNFWLRTCALSVGGSNNLSATFTEDDPSDNTPSLRIRFSIVQMANETPTYADIIVTNPDPSLAKAITQLKQYSTVQLQVGYQSMSSGVVFNGTMVQAIYGRESATDSILKIHAVVGDIAYLYGNLNQELPAGSTGLDVYNACLQAMQKVDPTIKGGYTSPKLLQLVSPSPQHLKGDASDYLRQISQNDIVNGLWTNDGGQLEVVGLGEVASQNATVLSYATGLIGQPEQTFQGIMMRSLINPNIKINSLVELEGIDVMEAQWDLGAGSFTPVYVSGSTPAVNTPQGVNAQIPSISMQGTYKVFQIVTTGDTYGNAWYQDLTCLAWNNGGLVGQPPANLLGNQVFIESAGG